MVVAENYRETIIGRAETLGKAVWAVLPVMIACDNEVLAYGYGSFFAYLKESEGKFSSDSDADLIIFTTKVGKSGILTAARQFPGLDLKVLDQYWPVGTLAYEFIGRIENDWTLLIKDRQIYF